MESEEEEENGGGEGERRGELSQEFGPRDAFILAERSGASIGTRAWEQVPWAQVSVP